MTYGITHTIGVYAADGMLVNSCPGSSADFINVSNIHTLEFAPGTLTTLDVEDNSGDGYLHGDNCHNEQSDDGYLQTVGGVETYVDYQLVMADASGNEYTVYVIDVGESPNTHASGNLATSYLTFDPDCPPPEGVELTCVSWSQTPKIPYEDFSVPCFAEGTRLRMRDGSVKAVEDIQPGDEVETLSHANGTVLWVGSSMELDATYRMFVRSMGTSIEVTKNHGMLVTLTDGTQALAAAKFLTEAEYADFLTVRSEDTPTDGVRVYHVLLATHEVVITDGGIMSESYFCGGWETLPAAEEALFNATGRSEHTERAKPRLKRRDADQIMGIRMVDNTRQAA